MEESNPSIKQSETIRGKSDWAASDKVNDLTATHESLGTSIRKGFLCASEAKAKLKQAEKSQVRGGKPLDLSTAQDQQWRSWTNWARVRGDVQTSFTKAHLTYFLPVFVCTQSFLQFELFVQVCENGADKKNHKRNKNKAHKVVHELPRSISTC